jgi:hypothetical protein
MFHSISSLFVSEPWFSRNFAEAAEAMEIECEHG